MSDLARRRHSPRRGGIATDKAGDVTTKARTVRFDDSDKGLRFALRVAVGRLGFVVIPSDNDPAHARVHR
jgi:hypothetical protein